MVRRAKQQTYRLHPSSKKTKPTIAKNTYAQTFNLATILILYGLLKLGNLPIFLIKTIFRIASVLVRLIFIRKNKIPVHKKTIRSIKSPQLTLTKNRVQLAVLILLIILGIYSVLLTKLITELPSPYSLQDTNPPLTSQIYDRKGNLLYQIYEGKNRQLINLDRIPKSLIYATVAIEDKHFFSHPGIDPAGIIRAVRTNLNNHQEPWRGQGGSTITQQLIKNTLLSTDPTITRKIKEVILAFWIERIYNKQQILQMYFNEVPYGGPAWGLTAAAQMYFNKNVSDLSLAESAYLAGLPAAPSQYSPYGTSSYKGKDRQREVLRRMVEDNYITQTKADQAISEHLTFRAPVQEIKAPHFVMYVRQQLVSKYGERVVSQGGLKIVTSLDLDIQDMVQSVVSEQVDKLATLKVSNGAAMVLDAKSGQILAMVGSKDYFTAGVGNYNVTLALRQPGSSIKVVTYTTAFKQGFSPGTVLLDTPVTFKPSAGGPWAPSYSPVNYDGRFHGPITLRTALGSSYNIPAVKTLAMIGIPNFLETAKELGITTFTNTSDYGLSLTLGGGDITMIEMMGVYDTFASSGLYQSPQAILTVTDAFGNVLEDHTQDTGKRVITAQIAYLITSILSDPLARAPAFGTNSGLEIPGHSVAVKTGTSDSKRDNWAFGYTPDFVVGAWVGNNNNMPMDQRLTSGITGATPIWHNIMVNLLADLPNKPFERPSGIVEVSVDGRRDIAISGQLPKTVVSSKKKMETDDHGKSKEVITYTDPFSSFIPKPSQTVQ